MPGIFRDVSLSCLIYLIVNSFIATYVSADVHPDLVYSELEHLLVDTAGANNGLFTFAITPCTNYAQTPQTLGRETASQWLRAAFHDFVTADVKAGTGGIDASIAYELDRPENVGTAFNDSLFFFANFITEQISMSDLMALGVVTVVGTCGGQQMSMRGGRVDATGPGMAGVPEPETDLPTTLARFSTAGFDQSDTIALTACGHTLGGVRHSNFPQIVTGAAITPSNTEGRAQFDTSVGAFDYNVVHEYVSNTGDRGGPLVTTSNVTVQSDLRLYTSDQNATIKRMASSPESFESTCVMLFNRMINTVPNGVTLGQVISPMTLKAVNTTIDIDMEGNMKLTGAIRFLTHKSTAPLHLPMYWSTRAGVKTSLPKPASLNLEEDTGSGMFGQTFYYRYTIDGPSAAGFSSFGPNDEFPISDNIFWVPAMSSSDAFAFGTEIFAAITVNITAAVLTSFAPSSVTALFSVPTPIPGVMNLAISKQTSTLAFVGNSGVYSIYSGSAMMADVYSFQASFDLIAENGGGERITSLYNRVNLILPAFVA